MKVTIEIQDGEIDSFIKKAIENRLNDIGIDSIIESKIHSRVTSFLKLTLSDEKIDNIARDRVSRIITSESLKDYTFGLDKEDVLSNVESKILLMIKHSKDFKSLVKATLKNSLQ